MRKIVIITMLTLLAGVMSALITVNAPEVMASEDKSRFESLEYNTQLTSSTKTSFISIREEDNPVTRWSNDYGIFTTGQREASPRFVSAGIGTNVVIAVAELWAGTTTNDIVIKKSSNMGASFSNLTTWDQTNRLFHPQAAWTGGSNFGIVASYEYSPTDYDVLFREYNASSMSVVSSTTIEGSSAHSLRPAIAGFNGDVYVFYWKSVSASNTWELILKKRIGGNWSGETILTSITQSQLSDDPYISATAYSGGIVLLTWTQKSNNNNIVYAARSTNNGTSWNTVQISNTSHNSMYPEVSYFGGNAIITWERWFSATDRDIYCKISTNMASSWSTESVLAGSSYDERLPVAYLCPFSNKAMVAYTNVTQNKIVAKYTPDLSNSPTWQTFDTIYDGTNQLSNQDKLGIGSIQDYGFILSWSQQYGGTDYDIYSDRHQTSVTAYNLSVQSQNPNSGVSITVSPSDNSGNGNGTTTFTRTYNSGTQVSLTAPQTASNNNFQKWTLNGSDYSTNRAINVTMDANKTLVAVYVNQTSIDDPSAIPIATVISGNYPNPFNPSTTIEYSVKNPSHVIMGVYNSRGALVKMLVDAHKTPGFYQITWNGEDNSGNEVSSGVYFIVLKAGSVVSSRKMLMMK